MWSDHYYQFGEVVKAHGIKGDLVIHLDTDQPANYEQLESVFLLNEGQAIPFFISALNRKGDFLQVSLEEIKDREQAEAWVGVPVLLPLDALPELPGNQFYYHELIGYQVVESEKPLGQVTAFYDNYVNPLLSIDWQGTEVLIPIHDHFIVEVDKSAKKLRINLPEGYLGVYNDTN